MSDKTWYIAVGGQQQGPFSLDELQVEGNEVRFAESVAQQGNGAAIWVSDEGTLLYVQEGGSSGPSVVAAWVVKAVSPSSIGIASAQLSLEGGRGGAHAGPRPRRR